MGGVIFSQVEDVGSRDSWAARPAAFRSPPYVRAVVFFVFALMPLTFVGGNAGSVLRSSAWAWILDLVLLALVLIREPLNVRAVRAISPYLMFLGLALLSLAWAPDTYKGFQTSFQLALPAVAYLVAWRIGEGERVLVARVSRLCLLCLPLIVIMWAAGRVGVGGFHLSYRPAAISLAVIFVMATITSRTWRRTVVIGVVCVLIAAVTGSRSATVVLLVLLLLCPWLYLPARWRVLIALGAGTTLLTFAQTREFKERFFFNPNASLLDLLTLSDRVNTAGRREMWSGLGEACSAHPILGRGIGAAYGLTLRITHGGINQPHNDYIRTYCDVGLLGSVLVWTFFIFVAVRAARRYRRPLPGRNLQAAAGLVVLAMLLFAVTDNVIVYAAHFMAPLGVVLGLADGAWDRDTVIWPRYFMRAGPAV